MVLRVKLLTRKRSGKIGSTDPATFVEAAPDAIVVAGGYRCQLDKLPPLISPVKKASRVETRVSHTTGRRGR